MKSFVRTTAAAVVLATALAFSSSPARAAADDYDDSIMHPLRVAAYLAHSVAFATEWLIARPFHFVISRPYLDRIFGYEPREED